PLSGERDDGCALLGYAIHFADLDKTFVDRLVPRLVNPLLTKRRRKMKRKYGSDSYDEGSGQHGIRLCLQCPQSHVRNQQRVGHIYQHVQPLPHRCREIPQPEIVARCSHQEQDDQCKETKNLKGEIGDTAVSRIADEQTDKRIRIPQRMKLKQREASMRQGQQKRRDTQVPAVIKERKESPVHSRQRSNTEHNVQQQECSCSKRANQQRLCRRAWVSPSTDTDKDGEVEYE